MRCKCTGWFRCSRRRTWIYNGKCYQHAMSYNFNMNSCKSLSKFWTIFTVYDLLHIQYKCPINISPKTNKHTCIRTFSFFVRLFNVYFKTHFTIKYKKALSKLPSINHAYLIFFMLHQATYDV